MTARLSPQREASIAADVAAYQKSHDHPAAFACCSAHAVADAAPELLAELAEVRAERDEARSQLAEYEPLNPQQCPAGKHTDWLVDSEYTHVCPWCRIDQLREELAGKRDEIAADIHRAELPVFAETENPALVAKTVRAIDVRLADRGSEAPYWVTKAGDRS